MNLKTYNQAEMPQIQEIYDTEAGLLGERIKRDPRQSSRDWELVELRVAFILIDQKFGEQLAEQFNIEGAHGEAVDAS